MKKYYCITVLALLVVILLQGYNMSLQYKDYIYNETDLIKEYDPDLAYYGMKYLYEKNRSVK